MCIRDSGGVFATDGQADRIELRAWFAAASSAIEELARAHDNASPVRCWPHHFDLATLLTLDPGADAEDARSVGIGFCSGDGNYDQPYFYVTPWPYPDASALTDLSKGTFWHTKDWTGAILTGEQILAFPSETRSQRVLSALEEAVSAGLSLLDR